MSYNCGLCGGHVPAGTPLRRLVVRRPDGQVDREIPVCPDCDRGAAPVRSPAPDVRRNRARAAPPPRAPQPRSVSRPPDGA